jgi:hypothetical protein
MKRIGARSGTPVVALALAAVLAIATGVPSRSPAPNGEWRASAADKATVFAARSDQFQNRKEPEDRVAGCFAPDETTGAVVWEMEPSSQAIALSLN